MSTVPRGSFAWKTKMYRESDELPYRGQAALVRRAGGGVELIVMPAPNTFFSSCVIPAEDVDRLRAVLAGEDDLGDLDLPTPPGVL